MPQVLEPLGFLRHFWRTEVRNATGIPVFLGVASHSVHIALAPSAPVACMAVTISYCWVTCACGAGADFIQPVNISTWNRQAAVAPEWPSLGWH